MMDEHVIEVLGCRGPWCPPFENREGWGSPVRHGTKVGQPPASSVILQKWASPPHQKVIALPHIHYSLDRQHTKVHASI
jgi:hypothetical protein